jgi:hypothetical protein
VKTGFSIDQRAAGKKRAGRKRTDRKASSEKRVFIRKEQP